MENVLQVGFRLNFAKGLINMMMLTHILKSIEFFIVEGLPEISISIESIEALFWQFAKIIEIYLSIL